ncbi:hypothetical protein UE98_23610 [Burkholderia cenocepacia]|nr:hypothetical protein [Burkholderia cenocepacia]OQD19332.1 hypothetical protein UE98_23610 [Burkholderia cenocepacia]
MKPSDFHIGLAFTCGPFWWRCTDVGSRTVTAIRLVEDDPIWYAGPPYMVEEIVFDEAELEDAYLSDDDATRAAISEADTSGHPGFPHEVVSTMFAARNKARSYPRQPLLRFDRVREDGEILHPYAAAQIGKDWVVKLYLPFTAEWAELPEAVFVRLAISTSADIKRRSHT